jgi:hypothetical protein
LFSLNQNNYPEAINKIVVMAGDVIRSGFALFEKSESVCAAFQVRLSFSQA